MFKLKKMSNAALCKWLYEMYYQLVTLNKQLVLRQKKKEIMGLGNAGKH